MGSRWQEQPEANRAELESLDKCADARNLLRRCAENVDEWAGIPLALEGEELVIEPSYPLAHFFNRPNSNDMGPHEVTIRNQFWSVSKRSTVIVYEVRGRIECGLQPGIHSLDYTLRTLGCSSAWGVEQESAAVHLLGNLIRHHPFKCYMLTGCFLETSKRSGITYLFRRLRPTIAISKRTGQLKILCSLCMHPIAYYAGSWAGAMCPTDDVIAHLMLMRADEAMFWRRCNQHAPHLPEAGI